jgi:hypothetical protein
MIFYTLSEWLLSVMFIAAFLAAGEAGFRLGHKTDARSTANTRSEILAVEGGILALLGLLLGFTMSMAVTRFEARKQAVLDEANAVGTSYRRAQLLPAPESADIRSLLRQYVDVRVQYGNAGEDPDRIKTTRELAAHLQDEIWTRAITYAQEDPNPVRTGLLLQSLNQVIDLEASRWMAFQNHVPRTVVLVNCVLALLAALFVGYTFGLGGRRQIFATCALTLAITAALVVIIDLDSPRHGLIWVGQQPMIDLQHQMLTFTQ